MKISINLKNLIVVLVGLFLYSLPGRALDNFKEHKKDTWGLQLSTNYFNTTANYLNSSGATWDLCTGCYYRLLDNTLEMTVTPTDGWSFFGWGTMSTAEARDSSITRKNNSLSQAGAGFDFVMNAEDFLLIPEFVVIFPVDKPGFFPETVLNNEGVFQAQARVIAQKDFGQVTGYGWLGYNYRDQGRSALLPWGIGARVHLRKFHVGGELFGAQTIEDDTNGYWNRTTVPITSPGSPQLSYSWKFNYPNPSVVDSQVYAEWNISNRWTFKAFGGTTLMGENTAAGYHAGALIRFDFDLAAGNSESTSGNASENRMSPRSKAHQESELSSEADVRKFRESTEDGVDQGAFKPRPTANPTSSDDSSRKSIQNQLDQAEIEVELKARNNK